MNKPVAAGVVVVLALALVFVLGSGGNVTPNVPLQNLPSTVSAEGQVDQVIESELSQIPDDQDTSLEDFLVI